MMEEIEAERGVVIDALQTTGLPTLGLSHLREEASVEDIDFRATRGLDRSTIRNLAQAGWVASKHNLLVTGPTAVGKSFVSCALAHAAVRRGHTALHVRTAAFAGGTCAQPR